MSSLGNPVYLGEGFYLKYTGWYPERVINPQYAEIPDAEKIGAILTCRHGIEGAILFNLGPNYDKVFQGREKWDVISWEPLTLTPSIQTGCCHGYIREGCWIDA